MYWNRMQPACVHRLCPGGAAPEMERSALLDASGVSPDEELSVKDVRRVFHKVLHVSVSPRDVEKAIRKVTGDTHGPVCGAGKLLDVLAEIENERVTSEELYWDFQMLNAGRLRTLEHLYAKDIKLSVRSFSPTMPWSSPCLHDQRQKNQEARTRSLSQERTHGEEDLLLGVSGLQGERLKKRFYARRLKKDVRRLCNRLSKAGLHVVLPSLCSSAEGPAGAQGIKTGETVPSDADMFQDVEDKYDTLRRKLCREMLQQHHGKGSWEALLPWQQEEREDALEALAEDALCSADPLSLCELPGAFRLYRCQGPNGSVLYLLCGTLV
ncbi:uncharacterized protein LOC108936446 isoform X2 [Scleropages formosus]|uniref:uncharacterized protein LOC108936446 isoform X2 n=1 Tax=Scleropages formosus TaxID=113540 RepID=UPI0008789044|nr:uncharacterized protein LOC108936446 isoform X2 [Scleropages formosus]